MATTRNNITKKESRESLKHGSHDEMIESDWICAQVPVIVPPQKLRLVLSPHHGQPDDLTTARGHQALGVRAVSFQTVADVTEDDISLDLVPQ